MPGASLEAAKACQANAPPLRPPPENDEQTSGEAHPPSLAEAFPSTHWLASQRRRGEAALPGVRRRLREAVNRDHDEPRVQQVGGRCSAATRWPPPRSTESSTTGGSSSSVACPTACATSSCRRGRCSKGLRRSDDQPAQFPMLFGTPDGQPKRSHGCPGKRAGVGGAWSGQPSTRSAQRLRVPQRVTGVG